MASSSDKTYTLNDLASALLDARRYHRAADELRNYHVARGEAFRLAFRLADHHRWHLDDLLHSTIESMLSYSSPVAGCLEAPREYVEFAERFRPDIDRASDELHRALGKMLMALLAELVEPGRKTVTADQLREHGFDPAQPQPDPLDYF